LWAQRSDKTQLQAALAKYEEAIAADPTNRQIAGRLVRGWYFLGDAHETEKEAKLADWDQAITWGKRCLAINTDFAELLQKGDEKESTAVRVLTLDDVPCLYWTSSSLGKWAKMSGLGKTLKNLPTVKAYITRVGELDPDYFYSGPDRYWGAYYSAIPSFAGQDLDKSHQHLQIAITSHPEYLGTTVILAEYWAVKSQDKAAFEEALNTVLAANPDTVAEIASENRAEQAKARKLMAEESDLFAD
ncbi:MAG: hypothetical protein GXP62_11240, partial [Oligoflexia bacterium]|nr:hypothetical protein [Oligoflexia bacterium]